MLQLKRGNLFKEKTEALVNTVNCVGVMGKGIALQFKQAFPENFKQYQHACQAKAVQPGQMFTVDRGALLNPRYIINFPTKRHWRQPSRIEDIQIGLAALVQEVQLRGITSIAVPPLGCGNGGLAWAEVKPLITQAFEALPDVTVKPALQKLDYQRWHFGLYARNLGHSLQRMEGHFALGGPRKPGSREPG